MDLAKIKSAVLNQLTGKNGLYSLKLQNHIYGCFIIMEDIAQQVVDLSGSVISTPKFSFDLDKQFGEIGIRYGFAMDSKLVLDGFNSEYKDAWLECFKDIDLSRDIEQSDAIEDAVIEIIQSTILTPDEAFFINALDTGSLPQEWIAKVFALISGSQNSSGKDEGKEEKEEKEEKEGEEEEKIEKTAIAKAITEKPIRRRLAKTRRVCGSNNNNKVSIVAANKKKFAKTHSKKIYH